MRVEVSQYLAGRRRLKYGKPHGVREDALRCSKDVLNGSLELAVAEPGVLVGRAREEGVREFARAALLEGESALVGGHEGSCSCCKGSCLMSSDVVEDESVEFVGSSAESLLWLVENAVPWGVGKSRRPGCLVAEVFHSPDFELKFCLPDAPRSEEEFPPLLFVPLPEGVCPHGRC